MATYRSFFLGPIIAGEGNAYCGVGCGSETDRTTALGIHVWDGAGRLRLCCRDCAEQYSDLARHVWPTPRRFTFDDLLEPVRKPARYVLVDAAELEGETTESIPVELIAELTTPDA